MINRDDNSAQGGLNTQFFRSQRMHLRRMPSFAGDVLDTAQSHGDLLLQITGASPRTVHERPSMP